MGTPALVWFRLDLRLSDNPALHAAADRGHKVLPLFIWAPEEEEDWPPGAASRWWIHHSLQSLSADLEHRGSGLVLRRGPTLDAIRKILKESGARAVFWNRRVEPALRLRDIGIKKELEADGILVETFHSSVLHDPETIRNSKGEPFRVFTHFWKACTPLEPLLEQSEPSIDWLKDLPGSLPLESLRLEPSIDWAEGLRDRWQPGESGAQKLLKRFLKNGIDVYSESRDYPAIEGTSRLSPHLHFGEISPRRLADSCAIHRVASSREFVRQLGWREFAHHMLYHFPHTASEPLRSRFARFPWRKDVQGFERWQRGSTGFAMVDAGMRQLWATGWMHNRARMIAGSFLVKDLMLHWKVGARWFWDTLVDADLANNTLGWQWVAGCGADAAPYFRIFNPDKQSEKFDPDREYVRRWLPEWETSRYPAPIVDHRLARERALEAFASIRTR